MEFVMLFFSAIIIVCIVGNKLSARIGVPSLLIFLALGMICGSDGILKIPFDNYQLSEQVCTVCLIFIMFFIINHLNINKQNQKRLNQRKRLNLKK